MPAPISLQFFADPLQSALLSQVVVEGQLPGAEHDAPPAPAPLMQQTCPDAQFDFDVHVYDAPAHAAPATRHAPTPPTTQQVWPVVQVKLPHFIGVIDGESAGVSAGGGVVSIITGVSPAVVSIGVTIPVSVVVSPVAVSPAVSAGVPVPVSSSTKSAVAPSLLQPITRATSAAERVR